MIAIITGGAQGIGAGIAIRLALDGFEIAIIDLTEESCLATINRIVDNGGKAKAYKADVANEEEVKMAVKQIALELGAPSVLVNNAGFAIDVNMDLMSTKQWSDVIGVHLNGSFLLTRECIPHFKRNNWGRIVNISSISAVGHADRANYCAAKAGMHGFIKSLAFELGPFGITANVVAPGLIVTAMTKNSAKRKGLSLVDHLEQAVSSIPVGRTGTPEDIAHAVSFFVSNEAGFVTGQVLYVAGMPVV